MRSGVTSSTGWPSWVGRNPALWCPEREVGKTPPLAPQLNHATAPFDADNDKSRIVERFEPQHRSQSPLHPAVRRSFIVHGRNAPDARAARDPGHADAVGRLGQRDRNGPSPALASSGPNGSEHCCTNRRSQGILPLAFGLDRRAKTPRSVSCDTPKRRYPSSLDAASSSVNARIGMNSFFCLPSLLIR